MRGSRDGETLGGGAGERARRLRFRPHGLGNIGFNSPCFISEEVEAQRGEVTCPMSHSNELAELELEPGPQDSAGFGPPKEMGSLGRIGTCTSAWDKHSRQEEKLHPVAEVGTSREKGLESTG